MNHKEKHTDIPPSRTERPMALPAFSAVGLLWVLCCLVVAGLLWAKASSLAKPGSSETAQSISVTGLETKNIEDVKPGDRVWAYDSVRDRWKVEPVIKPLVHEYAGDMVAISVAGQTITSTGSHPYWVASGEGLFDRPQAKDVNASDRASAVETSNGRWIEARKLQAGDLLVLRDGNRCPISEVQVSYVRQKVYNLEVAELHTYGVADAGVAVHNCPINCFPPGTLILMGDGSVKPIEQVELGDQVMAGDPLATGPPHPARVTGLIRDLTACLVDMSFRTPTGAMATITPTRYHPFWTNNRGWVEAKDLRAGDVLQDSGRNGIAVTSVKLRPHFGRSYNFEVAGVHTYYALANDRTAVLVHNQVIPYQPVPPGNEIIPYYPPNNGFAEGPWYNVLPPGSQFQRIGGSNGRFVAPPGTPSSELSIPFNQPNEPITNYTVVVPQPVDEGPASPWFNQPGGGLQQRLRGGTVQQLLNSDPPQIVRSAS